MKPAEILKKFLEDFKATMELACPACGGGLGRDEDGNDTEEFEHEPDYSWMALQAALPQIYKALESSAAHEKMVKALELARSYLGKAVADGLMQNCSRPPQFALKVIDEALSKANGEG